MLKVLSLLVFLMFPGFSFAADDPPDQLHIASLPGESPQETKARAQGILCQLDQHIVVTFPVDVFLHEALQEPDVTTSPVLQTWQVFGCSKATL